MPIVCCILCFTPVFCAERQSVALSNKTARLQQFCSHTIVLFMASNAISPSRRFKHPIFVSFVYLLACMTMSLTHCSIMCDGCLNICYLLFRCHHEKKGQQRDKVDVALFCSLNFWKYWSRQNFLQWRNNAIFFTGIWHSNDVLLKCTPSLWFCNPCIGSSLPWSLHNENNLSGLLFWSVYRISLLTYNYACTKVHVYGKFLVCKRRKVFYSPCWSSQN